MLLGQELKFKNKLCNLKLGTFFSAFPGYSCPHAWRPEGAKALYGAPNLRLLLPRFILELAMGFC